MKYKDLIDAAKTHLEKYPDNRPISNPITTFPNGSRWMYDRLNELDGNNRHPFNTNINYNFYGYIKYSICLTGAGLTAMWLAEYDLLLTPLSILIFYILEIQFLFLFPLLIDRSQKPVLTGIRATFKIGLFKCLFTVIPIAIYMITGLFRKKDRLHHWYVGCLSILIWYNNEVRDRISPSF